MYRTEYPRPDFWREEWLNLNGPWEFTFDGEAEPRTIEVPFAFQSKRSGIGDNRLCDRMTYRRTFHIPLSWGDKRVKLHFGAVDYEASVFVNGQMVGTHTGGSVGFSFDITGALTGGEEELVVKVYDPCRDETIPRGKQFWVEHSAGIWYTRTSGIWQTVWLEPVAPLSLEYVRFTPDVDQGMVTIDYQLSQLPSPNTAVDFTLSFQPSDQVNTAELEEISFPSVHVTDYPTDVHGRLSVDLYGQKIFRSFAHGNGICWTPESPSLFSVTAVVSDGEETDRVESYFGLRKIHTENGKVFLNNRPYYQKLILDQGYWPDTLLTPPNDAAMIADIQAAKDMGFNGCRKHQKTEDPRFLYLADQMGFLVWEEIASAIQFTPETVHRLEDEWYEAFARDYNHPSVVAWAVINESWSVPYIKSNPQHQSLALALYYTMHAVDPTRLVIANDGWEMAKSDLCAIHNYDHGNMEQPEKQAHFREWLQSKEKILNNLTAGRPVYADGYEYGGEPILITECGGIAYDISSPGGWGYTVADDEETFLAQYEHVISSIMTSNVLYGFCYTQLTDVEQEINGLLTYDRQSKCDLEKIKEINSRWRHPDVY